MKYNVLGFYQPRAVELGLCSDDLLVLRWFVDFAGTPKMRTMIIDNQIYYWVNYSTVLEELPILRISKQTLYKKHFTNLCNANVLIHKQVKDGGNFSYYCYGINYETLVYLQSEEDPLVKNNDLMSKSTKGSVEMYQTLMSKSTKQRLDNNIINLQDNKIEKEIYKEKIGQIPTDVQNSLISNIFNYWNSKDIIKHKELTDAINKAITKALKTYTEEEIKKYINRYDKVLKDNSWFFDYKWSLENFLTRKDGISSFTDEGSKWINYCSNNHTHSDSNTKNDYSNINLGIEL